MDARARFLDAKDARDLRGVAAALRSLSPGEIDDDVLLEILALSDIEDRRARGEIDEFVWSVVWARSARPADDLFWMAVEWWSTSSAFGSQRACDAMAKVLARTPDDLRALRVYLDGSLGDEPYLHRGIDLDSIAASAPAPVAARLLVAEAFIRHAAKSKHAREYIDREKALDASVDVEAVRAL